MDPAEQLQAICLELAAELKKPRRDWARIAAMKVRGDALIQKDQQKEAASE